MSRLNYWSSSWLANWLRNKFGLPRLKCGTSKEWKEWRAASKAKSKFIHWFTMEFLDKLQDFFNWPKDKLWNVRCAINARYFDKYHYLPTRLNPWQYHEIDTRVLHGLFETLVDFIEIEKAWMHVIWGQEENRKKFGYTWYEMNGWIRPLAERRHPEAGLDYLQWEMSLVIDESFLGFCEEHIAEAKKLGTYGTMTSQAISAKEQFDLYHWWKNIRPNRPDPYEASGFNSYFAKMEKKNGGDFLAALDDSDPSDIEESLKCHKSCDEIEEAYEKEDEEMMIRLIKIRKSLWT